jgi:hypothetical protein
MDRIARIHKVDLGEPQRAVRWEDLQVARHPLELVVRRHEQRLQRSGPLRGDIRVQDVAVDRRPLGHELLCP